MHTDFFATSLAFLLLTLSIIVLIFALWVLLQLLGVFVQLVRVSWMVGTRHGARNGFRFFWTQLTK